MDLQTQEHLRENRMSNFDAEPCNGNVETESLKSAVKGMSFMLLLFYSTSFSFFVRCWDVLPVFLWIHSYILLSSFRYDRVVERATS